MPAPTKTQLIGGAFQDTEGNVLANGYLMFFLNQDSEVNNFQICSGVAVRIQLDSAGNVASSSSTPPAPNQFIWATDVLLPVNAYYRVTGYTVNGQIAWGPNNQQVTSGGVGGGTFNLGTWIPNSVFSWVPSVQNLALQTNEVANGSQTLLDLHAGSGITLTDNGSGRVTIVSSGGAVPAGGNIVSIPWNRATLGGSGINNTSITEASGTAITIFTAPVIQLYPSLWNITIEVSDPNIPFDNMVLARTAPGSLTVVDLTTLTFGGSSTPTLAQGVNVSDAISLQIDAAHDYYFMIHTASGSPHNSLVSRAMGPQFVGGVMGTGFSDQTHVSPIQNPVFTGALASGMWISAWKSA